MRHACLDTTEQYTDVRRSTARHLVARVLGMITAADRTLALWHDRARYRREIEQMDERLLRDAGLDRSEAFKPFWKP
jgi:uncharacterized protein YjiS (DUF1127 family)